jgi:hypothetical protein
MCDRFSCLLGLAESIEKITEADVIFKCKDGEISAYSVILKARSDVFKTMLESSFAEAATKTIELEHSVKTATALKKYIYAAKTPEMGELNIKELFELYSLADQYMLAELKSEIFHIIYTANRDVDKVLEVLSNMDGYFDSKSEEMILNEAVQTIYYPIIGKGYNLIFPKFDMNNIPDKYKARIFDSIIMKTTSVRDGGEQLTEEESNDRMIKAWLDSN